MFGCIYTCEEAYLGFSCAFVMMTVLMTPNRRDKHMLKLRTGQLPPEWWCYVGLCVSGCTHQQLFEFQLERMHSSAQKCVCVCVNIASPFLDPTSFISWGSVLVTPGDSQSVLALQYKEVIVKKRPLWLGSVLYKSVCGTSQLEYVFVWETGETVCMEAVTVTHYIFIRKPVCEWKRMDVMRCRALVTCLAMKKIETVIVQQQQIAKR